eukprot:ANDGO_05439.mRNA.1 hypothetical protein
MSSVLGVVEQLKTLCSNPQNQPYIARRGILPSLIGILQHLDLQVVLTACQAIQLLALCPDNHVLLVREPQLMPTLWNLFRTFHTIESTPQQLQICECAASCLVLCGQHERSAELYEYATRRNLFPEKKKDHPIMEKEEGLNKIRELAKLCEDAVAEGQQRSNCILFVSSNEQSSNTSLNENENPLSAAVAARPTTYHALSSANKKRLEHALLSTKGVLSFSWTDANRLSLYTFLVPEKLAAIVRLRCDVRVRLEEQQVDMISREARSNVLGDAGNKIGVSVAGKAPAGYLTPEEIEKVKLQQRIQEARAVLTARGDDSLAARIALMNQTSAHAQSQQHSQNNSGVRGFFSKLLWP